MIELVKLTLAMAEVICPDRLVEWLEKPSEAFGTSPAELIASGKTEPLWRMVHRLGSGELS